MAEYFEREYEALQALSATVTECLLAQGPFRSRLLEILGLIQRKGLVVDLEVRPAGKPGVTLARYGTSVARDPFHSSTSDGQTGAVEAVVHWWVQATPSSLGWRAAVPQLTTELFRLINAHWGERDDVSLLPRITVGRTPKRLEAAIASQCQVAGRTTGALIDLDKFKQINTDFSYAIGTKVIAEFAARLRDAFGEDSMIVHQGGDEFLLILADSSLPSALYRLNQFRRRMSTDPFADIDRINTCTIAVAGYPDLGVAEIGPDGWRPVFDAAFESITARKPDRNALLFPTTDMSSAPQVMGSSDLVRAVLLARADVDGEAAWPWAFDAAVIRVLEENFGTSRAGSTEALSRSVQDTWRAMSVPAGLALDAGGNVHNRGLNPVVRWIASVLAALLRSAFGGVTCLGSRDVLYLVPAKDRTAVELQIRGTGGETRAVVPLISAINCEPEIGEACAGGVWVTTAASASAGIVRSGLTLGRFVSPYLVIEVGDARVEPAIAAAGAVSIRVDARPVTGGGLPDFWQSNVARVVTTVLENPNISHILVAGDQKNIHKTAQFLEARAAGEDVKDYVARRLGFDEADLAAFTVRRVAIVHIPESTEEALRVAAKVICDASSVDAIPRPISQQRQRARRVHLPEPSTGRLSVHDGLRLRSLAEAYPTVIQLLRTMKGDVQRDRSERDFLELPAFKLVLENPATDIVPEFWSDDDGRAELRDYYGRVFEAPAGLFGARLQGWRAVSELSAGFDQIAQAEEAIVRAVQDKVADRRILLTIGAPPLDGAQPLGLSVVHALPRTFDRKWRVDFVWVWRSVEALVGFPFSAYGSIQQSLHIVDAVNACLGASGQQQISLGLLTYVALSMHMYVGHDGDDEIARAVITEALA